MKVIKLRRPYFPEDSIKKIQNKISLTIKDGTLTLGKNVSVFEKKFARDQELQFKVAARSNKYLAEFVSSRLGKSVEDQKAYTQEIIKADMEKAGSEDVFRKIKKDFQTASISIEDSEIRDQMEKALLRAKEDFK